MINGLYIEQSGGIDVYYLFLFSTLCYQINISFGIDLGGMRISISDILAIICFARALKRTALTKSHSIAFILLLITMIILWTPLGIASGGTISQCLRVIRNWLFAFLSMFIIYDHFLRLDDEHVLKEVCIISGIAVFDGLYNILTLYMDNHWFKNYRVNSCLFMALFVFLLFYKTNRQSLKDNIIKWSMLVLILICSAMSQERTQLVIDLFVVVVCLLLNVKKVGIKAGRIINKRTLQKTFGIGIAFLFFVIVVWLVLKNNETIQEYIDYYLNYRIAILFDQSGKLQTDSSLNTRLVQVVNIVFNNLKFPEVFSLLVGNGTCSVYNAGYANTFIVDGMCLWIVKDLGLIGLFLFIGSFIKEFQKADMFGQNSISYVAMILSFFVASLVKPAVMYDIYDAFAFGMILGLVEAAYIHQKKEIMMETVSVTKLFT